MVGQETSSSPHSLFFNIFDKIIVILKFSNDKGSSDDSRILTTHCTLLYTIRQEIKFHVTILPFSYLK